MTFPSTTNQYIKSLDGLRAIAILLVMAFHADIITYGWMGVQLFFVLSGYLIINILWKEKAKPGTIGQKMKKFWIRRSLRIFPLYFAFIAVMAALYIVFKAPPSFREYFLSLVTYTFNFALHLPEKEGPVFTFLWSLSVEEQFYLFFPLIVFLLPSKFTKYLMLLIILAAPVFRYYLGEHYLQAGVGENIMANKIYWNTLSHMDAFFIGGAIAVFDLPRKIKQAQWLFIAALVLVVALGILNYLHSTPHASYWLDFGYAHGIIDNYIYVWEYTALNLLFATIILLLVSPFPLKLAEWFKRCLETAWMVRIGRVSYGMYIYHFFVIIFIYRAIIPDPGLMMKIIFFIPYVLAVYIISEISYRFFESYFIKLKDKL